MIPLWVGLGGIVGVGFLAIKGTGVAQGLAEGAIAVMASTGGINLAKLTVEQASGVGHLADETRREERKTRRIRDARRLSGLRNSRR